MKRPSKRPVQPLARRRAGEPDRGALGKGLSELSVEAFRDISILFPGDMYALAAWIALRDQALSTPTCRPGTTLNGLARQFASLADSPGRPWTTEMVLERLREHGLPIASVIRIPPEHAEAVTAFLTAGGPGSA